MLIFVTSNTPWSDGELTIEFRQLIELIAMGVAGLKQKKATRVGSDALYQAIFHERNLNLRPIGLKIPEYLRTGCQ